MSGPHRGLDRFETGLLALFGALSLWVVGSDVVIELTRGWHWTRTDGFFSGDQLQYLAWIQSSARHGLVSDLFVLRTTPADYLQPAIMLSALLVRLGVPSWLALMLWKPVAVIALFLAARALAAHCLQRTFDRRAALVLAVLFGSLSDVYGSVGVIGDMMPMWQSWGYPFGLIGVALISFGLLAYARARDAGQISWAPGLLGGLAATVHPWQGELMFLVIVLAELVRLRPPRRARIPLRLAVLTLGLIAIPLLYYFGLGHVDPVWRMAQAHAKHTFSSSAVLIAAAPLLAFALLGYRGAPADFLELLLRAWAPATLIIWVFSASALGATPLHAVNGLTLPLAVLAVLGVRRVGLDRLPRARALACLAIAVGTVPAIAYTMAYAHTFTNPTPGNANFVTADESRALAWLRASPIPGGVLSGFYLGEAIPGITGRQDFVGDCLWSEPNCFARSDMVDRLFDRRLTTASARRFVTNSGARFLIGGCGSPRRPVTRQLAGLTVAERRFGCATVWQLADRVAGHPARGPLAQVGGEWIVVTWHTDETMRLFALRGANSVTANDGDAILGATDRLIRELMERNRLAVDAFVSCIFTLTPDLDAEFPAVAARRLGFDRVPLLCAREIPVPGALPSVIRVLAHYYADEDHEPRHVYLGDAQALRQDLNSAQ